MNIVSLDGRLKLLHELDPDTRAAVASFEVDQYGVVKYGFWRLYVVSCGDGVG